MKKTDFNYHIPDELIAKYPLSNRSDSKMLVYFKASNTSSHHLFSQITDFINPGDLLVMNDSKVLQARFFGNKLTGGKVEFLVERILSPNEFLAHIKASKSPKNGSIISLENSWQIEVVEKQDSIYLCKSSIEISMILSIIGHMPLPPYIDRKDEILDVTRYQTIYAKHLGSVAAPTAGLHFDEKVINSLKAKGVNFAYTTLHIGAGTFQPVREMELSNHQMHTEKFIVDRPLVDAILLTKKNGGRIIAVGTTAMRSLESWVADDKFEPTAQDTNIFITPGYKFKICDGLITNFHLPESTLLMLVSGFIGYENAMQLYKIAIENKYRFFSYGDVSLLI